MQKYYTSDSWLSKIKRALSEFLLLPLIIVILFLLAAYASYKIDHEKIVWLKPMRQLLRMHIFSDAKSTSSLLGAIVSGTISITSLTTTLLLVIVQQSAGSMTTQVFDQFLRRRTNQFYLGYFVGLSLYSMITLATVNDPFNPVLGGALAFLLTGIALCLLVILMYTTIDQMRPAEIINAIYERIVKAAIKEKALIAHTTENFEDLNIQPVKLRCQKGGFLTYIDTCKLSLILHERFNDSKVKFTYAIGDYVALNNCIAEIYPADPQYTEEIKRAISKCISIQVQRDIDFDAAFGIIQLETIAWTSTSTAHSNPAPGRLCVNVLQNIVACWSDDDELQKAPHHKNIYYKNNLFNSLINSLESIAVVSSESMQHQVFISILNLVDNSIETVPPHWQSEMELLLLRMLAVMGDMAMTFALDKALTSIIAKLNALEMTDSANKVAKAQTILNNSVGKLNSRSTRVPV